MTADRGSRLGYVPALDGVRGVAILLVLAAHFAGFLGAELGVDLFFVLSGFLITTLLVEELDEQGRLSLRSFYARRVRRLLPALAVLLAAFVLIEAAKGQFDRGLVAVGSGGFYTANLVQAFGSASTLASSGIAHLWSLAEEEQFYLVWPLLLVLLARRRRLSARWAALAFTALVCYRGGLALAGASHLRLYMGPDTHADGLVAGALLALLHRRGWRVPEPAAAAGFALFMLGVFWRSIAIQTHPVAFDVFGLPVCELAGMLIVGAAVAPTSLAEALSSRPLVGLGKISYSLYLWHYLLDWAFGLRTGHTERAVWAFGIEKGVAVVALSLLAAYASYRYVELPLRRRRRVVGAEPVAAAVSV